MGERAWQGARCTGRCSGYASVGVLLPFLSFILTRLEALIVTAPADHRWRHLTKIGVESEDASWLFITGVTTTRMRVHRENDETRFIRPRDSGGGDHP